MHLSMATLTTTIDHPNVRADSSWKICPRQKIVGVTSGRVALLAEKRSGGCQQHLMIGTVRRMAIQAAFANRGVTENEGTALFGMALKADFVDRICFQQGVRRAAVGIMAIATGHLTLEKRHMRALAEFHTLLLMTAKACLMHRLFA